MREYKLTRNFIDNKGVIVDKLNFESFEDATKEAGKWIKSDENLRSVVVENGEYKLTYERPQAIKP